MALNIWSSKLTRAWIFSICALCIIALGLGAYFRYFYVPGENGSQTFDKVVIPAKQLLKFY